MNKEEKEMYNQLMSYVAPLICPTYEEKKHQCLAKQDKKCPEDCSPHGDNYLRCSIFSKWFWWNRQRLMRKQK